MRRIARLRLEALESCWWRGHDMGRFHTDPGYTTQRYAFCKVCGRQVVINENPWPNEIDIGGEAVALECGSPSRFNRDGSIRRDGEK